MGLAEGFGAGMQLRSQFRLNQANAANQELQNQMLQQQFDGQNSLRDQMFQPPDYQMVNHPAVETAPSNLHDIIGQAAQGRAPSNYDPYASVAPQVRGAYQQQQPMLQDLRGDNMGVMASLSPGRHMPATFGAYQPAPHVNRMERPSVELAGPGEAIDGLNGNQIPREALRDGGPGTLAEGPRPMSEPTHENIPGAAYQPAQITPGRIADEAIPGTGGPLAHLSPQMQEIGKAIMRQNGGDYAQTALTLNLLTNGQANLPMPSTPHAVPYGGSLAFTTPLGNQVGGTIQGNPKQYWRTLTDRNGVSWKQNPYTGDLMPSNPSDDASGGFSPYLPGSANVGGKAGQDVADLYAREFPSRVQEIESMTGQPFTFDMYRKHATPEEKAHMRDATNQQAVSQAGKIAGVQAEAGINKQLDQPLSLTDANKVGMPAGTTMRKAKDMELMAPDLKQKQDYYHFASAGNILDDIFKYAKDVPDVKPGLINTLVGGSKNYAASLGQTNHAAKMLEIKKGEVALVVRALGESGALATLDVERVKSLLPQVWDTMAIRESKMKDLMQLFETNYQSYVQSHSPMTSGSMRAGGPGSKSNAVTPNSGRTTPARTAEEQAIYDKARAKSAQNMRQREVSP